ncbi:MAG TPA: ROK family protein [Acidimicrobiales bacterium]|jgi:polyphosphate glucokinase|nr:ROK family protein [Acidimicrobiales bacterium]
MSDDQPPPEEEVADPEPPATITPNPHHPLTLAVDVGGTGLKASVLDADGAMVADRVKVPTPYPIPPDKLVTTLGKLVAPLPKAERASVGFPGMVRAGMVLSAPHFSCKHGPGSPVDDELAALWSNFDLTTALTEAFGMPTKVANDADVQGAAVVSGNGLEFVMTLGTGFGSGLFYEGRLMPHLEIAHQPFRKGETYNDQIGEAARKEIGEERWNRRVQKAIKNMRALMFFDHLYIGGGNSRRLVRDDLDDDVTIVDNTAGILGGIKLWETDHVAVTETDS